MLDQIGLVRPFPGDFACIQTTWPSDWRAPLRNLCAAEIISPRLMSISSARVSVTDMRSEGEVEVAVESRDAFHPSAAGGKHVNGIAGTNAARGDLARVSAKTRRPDAPRAAPESGTAGWIAAGNFDTGLESPQGWGRQTRACCGWGATTLSP